MTTLIIVVLLFQALFLIALVLLWKSLVNKHAQLINLLTSLLTPLNNQPTILRQAADQITTSAQEVTQLASDHLSSQATILAQAAEQLTACGQEVYRLADEHLNSQTTILAQTAAQLTKSSKEAYRSANEHLNNQATILAQTAERLAASTQEVKQMAVDLSDIAAWTKHQRDQQEAALASAEPAQLIAALEQATDPTTKTLYLAKLFASNAHQLTVFMHFLEIASNQIDEAIKNKQIDLVYASLNNTTRIVETYGPALPLDDIKSLIRQLEMLRKSAHQQVNEILETMLSEVDQSSITLPLLEMLENRGIDQGLLDKLREKRKEMEITLRSQQARLIASSLQREVDGIEGHSDDAVNRLQHLQIKLIRLTQSDDSLATMLLPLKQNIETKRNRASKEQRMAQLFSDTRRIADAMHTLSEFNEPVLTSGDRLVKADEAAKLMTFVCSQCEALGANGDDVQPPIKINTKAVTAQIQNIETSKFNSYQTWALGKIESALTQLNEKTSFWDKFPGVKKEEDKSMDICTILSSTLWLIDEQALANPVSALHHAIESKLHNKVKEETRLGIIKKGLLHKRLTLEEINL